MRAWTRLRSRFGGSAPAAVPAGRDVLKWVAAAFALVATATAEYEIARAIGMNEWVAAAVPGALDAYVVRALRAHREVLTAVLAMVAVNAASHLVTADVLPVAWPLITAVSAIAPLVLWRVHALGTPGQWRERKLWDLSKAEHADVLASTERCVCGDPIEQWTGPGEPGWIHSPGSDTPCLSPCTVAEYIASTRTVAEYIASTRTEPEHTEHDRAPDNPEPPGTREHPEGGMPYLCPYGCVVWGDVEAHVQAHEHTPSTLDLDVPAWVNPPSTPAVPVHAPYVDHVLIPSTPSTRRLHAVHDGEHTPDPENGFEHAMCSAAGCVLGPDEACPRVEHTASTRTADDWNLEHVSTGVLEPEDTEHMERARELFHTIGGVPPFRALKEGNPGMGTPRATRIRAALKAENAEGTS